MSLTMPSGGALARFHECIQQLGLAYPLLGVLHQFGVYFELGLKGDTFGIKGVDVGGSLMRIAGVTGQVVLGHTAALLQPLMRQPYGRDAVRLSFYHDCHGEDHCLERPAMASSATRRYHNWNAAASCLHEGRQFTPAFKL